MRFADLTEARTYYVPATHQIIAAASRIIEQAQAVQLKSEHDESFLYDLVSDLEEVSQTLGRYVPKK